VTGTRELARRRAELVERSTRLRAEITAAGVPLQARLATADRVIGAARAHPILTGLLGAGAALLIGRTFPSLSRVLRFVLLFARL